MSLHLPRSTRFAITDQVVILFWLHSLCVSRNITSDLPLLYHTFFNNQSHQSYLIPNLPSHPSHKNLFISLSQLALLIRLNDDIFSSNRIINHRRLVWEEAHEEVIEDSGSEEGVDVANGETLYSNVRGMGSYNACVFSGLTCS